MSVLNAVHPFQIVKKYNEQPQKSFDSMQIEGASLKNYFF